MATNPGMYAVYPSVKGDPNWSLLYQRSSPRKGSELAPAMISARRLPRATSDNPSSAPSTGRMMKTHPTARPKSTRYPSRRDREEQRRGVGEEGRGLVGEHRCRREERHRQEGAALVEHLADREPEHHQRQSPQERDDQPRDPGPHSQREERGGARRILAADELVDHHVVDCGPVGVGRRSGLQHAAREALGLEHRRVLVSGEGVALKRDAR